MSKQIKLSVNAKGVNAIKKQAEKVIKIVAQLTKEIDKLSKMDATVKIKPDESGQQVRKKIRQS